MPWLWTDDLAALLADHDGVDPKRLVTWLQRPVAVPVAEGTDPLEVARRMLGAPPEAEAVA